MAINLTATNHSLEVITGAAVATTVVSSFKDKTSSAETSGSDAQNISTATTTTIVAAPAASTQRQVEDVEILVTGSGSTQITAQKDVGGTNFPVLNVLLGTGERAHFTSAFGWRVFDTFGREKDTVGFTLLKAPTLLTSGTTFTPSIGCTALLIELWGGGGQGGGSGTGAAAQVSAGAGGSTGGKCRKFVIGVPSSITYATGAAGSGAAGTAAGTAGGNTTMTINGVTYTATGGPGGTLGVTGSTVAETAAPAAVSGTNGDENITTESGGVAVRFSGTQGFSGRGGQSDMGNAGAIRGVQGVGGAASGFNAGGGGGLEINTVGSSAGGVGAPGCIRVWEFAG